MSTERQLTDVLSELSSAAILVVGSTTTRARRRGCKQVTELMQELMMRAAKNEELEAKIIYNFWKMVLNRDFAVKHNRSFENNVWRTFGTIRDVAMENRYTPRVTVLCNRIITA
ncbi:hypothetical protein KW798_03805, partial [Candidatus Parcubacteria bacterium]|nr:hypothetical protein [Candidatus Parcubacteria bacterium]